MLSDAEGVTVRRIPLGLIILGAAIAISCLVSIYGTHADHSDDHPRVATVSSRPESIALYIAKRKELDKKQKLDIARMDVKSSDEAFALLQQNKSDVALGHAVNAMLMFAKGARIRIIGVVAGNAPYSLLASRSAVQAKDLSGKQRETVQAKDLSGKLIGVANSEESFLLAVVMRQGGVREEEVKTKSVPGIGEKILQLDRGDLGGAMFQWPSQLQAIRTGKMQVVVDVPDVVRSYVYSVMVVEEGYVAKHGAAGVRLLRVMTATTEWLASSDNNKESAALIREYFHEVLKTDLSETDAAKLREMLIQKGVLPRDPRPDPSMFELNMQFTNQILKNGKINIDQLLDPSLAKEIR